MTTEQINSEISRLESLISEKNASAEAWRKKGQEWILPAQARDCKRQGYHPVLQKGKIAACENEKASQIATGSGYIKRADDLEKEITGHKERITELSAQIAAAQQSAAEVAQILANQGKTGQSVQYETEKKAEAEKEATLLRAQADASAAASNKKKIGTAIAITAVVAVLILGFFLFKKIKKK